MDTSNAINFDNRVIGTFDIFGYNVWITQTIVSTWIVMAILMIFALVVRARLNKFKSVPTGFQNFIEVIVDTMDKFCIDNMGEKYSYFGGWFFGMFLFILCSNLLGLFNLRPPTSDIATTAAFGITTFLMIHVFGIMKSKKDYFKGFLEPLPFLLPLNILGEVAVPISLSFRLFGNLLGGVIIMGLVYALFPLILKLGVPAMLHIYFDIFAGGLQAYIFVILSMTFIKGKLPE
jgi:F-type H+-transporting ATPase subunit a